MEKNIVVRPNADFDFVVDIFQINFDTIANRHKCGSILPRKKSIVKKYFIKKK
jgi:hypothetical protein